MSNSRIPGFYKLSLADRIGELQRRGWLSAEDASALRDGRTVLTASNADRMIENAVGVFGLPFAIAPNFTVNGRDYLVPMVVEEPSILAALSNAASLAGDGFRASCDESLLVGQIHVTGAGSQASVALRAASDELLRLANAAQPRLQARGGGARELEIREFELAEQAHCIAVHLAVDTRDAMGANLVNTMCEAIAPRIADISGGQIAMRILSNLCDRSVVTASVRYKVDALGNAEFSGEAVRDGVSWWNPNGSALSAVWPWYRETTWNLYIDPGPAPGMNSSHNPFSSRFSIGSARGSQWLKSPITEIDSAAGAQTANRTPAVPFTVSRCAPRCSYSPSCRPSCNLARSSRVIGLPPPTAGRR